VVQCVFWCFFLCWPLHAELFVLAWLWPMVLAALGRFWAWYSSTARAASTAPDHLRPTQDRPKTTLRPPKTGQDRQDQLKIAPKLFQIRFLPIFGFWFVCLFPTDPDHRRKGCHSLGNLLLYRKKPDVTVCIFRGYVFVLFLYVERLVVCVFLYLFCVFWV